MRRLAYGIVLTFLIATSVLVVGAGVMRTQEYAAGSPTRNVVVDGDFETGNLNGWTVNGLCSISNIRVHSGSYSAYVSDYINDGTHSYDNSISQGFIPMNLPVDNGLTLDTWIYPNRVGGLDTGYPSSSVYLTFYDNMTGQPAFTIQYSWCWSLYSANATSYLLFTFPSWSVSQWNELQRDVTADVHFYFGRTNFTGIYLNSMMFAFHFSNQSPGAFWIDDVRILTPIINPPPIINSVNRTPDAPNYNQNVEVTAAVDGADQSILSYSTDNVNWNNVTMTEAGNLFNATIPAQPYNTSVHYEVYAYNNTIQNWAESDAYSYIVSDDVPPNVNFVAMQGTSPYPLVPSSNVRQGEPFLVEANASDNGSGINYVMVSYENNGTSQGEWTSTTMVYNVTTGLWVAILPGQPSSATVEFFCTAYDNAGNINTTSTYIFAIQHQFVGDINGDGKVDMRDLGLAARHFGEGW